jgi:hypothetical protein
MSLNIGELQSALRLILLGYIALFIARQARSLHRYRNDVMCRQSDQVHLDTLTRIIGDDMVLDEKL